MLDERTRSIIHGVAVGLRKFCLRLGCSVEDIEQDLTAEVLEAMPNFNGGNLGGFVRTVLSRGRAHVLRRADKQGPLQLSALVEDEGFDAVDEAVVMRF